MKNIVIIGAGLGGLTVGALLAKNGYKVTLLEQHNIVGGCATTFKRKGGFTCEVGLHEMDGVYTSPSIVKIFKELNVYENVEFIKVNELFEVETKSGTFKMPDGIDAAIEALINEFPEQKNAIKKYFNLIEKIAKQMGQLLNLSWYHYALFPIIFKDVLMLSSKTVTEVFNKLFTNEELKLILNSNVNYYNDTPDTLSFLMHAVAQYSYYSGGGYFIKGGSGRLSDYLANVIYQNGGEIILKAEVISCSETKVEYIHKKERHSIECNKIVSNLSPQSSYKLFNIAYKERREIADSLLTVYLGFSKNIKDVYGKGAYSSFFMDNLSSTKDLKLAMQKDIFNRPFIFVDYSQIDSNLTKDSNKSFGAICLVDRYEDWKKLSKDEYKERKQKVIEHFLTHLEQKYPNIKELVEYAEVGTAKTVERYIKTPAGTAYGFKPTPKNFFKIPKVKSKKVDNLYFVGQWVIAGGFSPAIMSGGICFEKLTRNMQ